jgi:uncharacterized protein
VTQLQNPFVWHDLLTLNVSAAKTFYAKVLRWKYLPQDQDYHVTMVDDLGVGGIMKAPDYLQKIPPFWSPYLHSSNVDRACKKASDLGAIIFRAPWEIPNGQRMAVIADPTGAVFNLIQPRADDKNKKPKSGTVGTVGWHELHTGDLGIAWDFYAGMFGWSKGTSMDMGDAGIYQMFEINGKNVGGMMLKQKALPRPMWFNYFNVDGIEAAVARITKAGGKIAMGPHQVPNGQWIVSAFDPQGGNFQLVSATK